MKEFKDLKVGDDVFRLDKNYILTILKVSNIIKFENGILGIDLVSEDGMSSVALDIRPYYVDHTEYLYYVNGDDYWFYSDPVTCSRALSGHIQYLSNMIVNFTDIKDQLISGRV